jgi:hypothetical protein
MVGRRLLCLLLDEEKLEGGHCMLSRMRRSSTSSRVSVPMDEAKLDK